MARKQKKLVREKTHWSAKPLYVIAGQVEQAIKHAKILDQGKDLQAAPSTKVFKLVEKLVEKAEV